MIYPFPLAEIDDKTLKKQIKAIAQVLCNVHHLENECSKKIDDNIPLSRSKNYKNILKWSQWARECVANYNKLVEMGLASCAENDYRHKLKLKIEYKPHKMFSVILWARDNVPNLIILDKWGTVTLNGRPTPFPLVTPKKFRFRCPCGNCDIRSYRNYYRHKLQQKIKKLYPNLKEKVYPRLAGIEWTRREKPEWLKL